MNEIKPVVDELVVARVLEGCIGQPPLEINRMPTGQISATFQCVVRDATLVVQFSEPNMAAGLTKERFFHDRFRSVGVPTREVICDGTYESLKYTIAKKAHGQGLTTLVPEKFKAALPSVFDTLLAISSVDMKGTEGYGWFDELGRGPYETWQAHLSQIQDEEPGMFYGNWHEMFNSTFLERDRFETYFSEMMRLLNAVSVPRLLVHGGFGYDNVLVENGTVTAVLVWQDARFGDPLFDLAYIDFWPSGYNLINMFEIHCDSLGIRHKDFQERVLGCKYYIALDSMRFFAKIDNRDAYDAVVKIIDGLRT